MTTAKLLLITLLLSISLTAQAQYCTSDDRFTAVKIFGNQKITEDTSIVYGTADDYTGIPETLVMDIRYPSFSDDTLSKRPFIMLIHGGGFDSGTKEIMSLDSRYFTQKGFVTASVGYRTGYDDTNPKDNLNAAAYRAQQDVNAASRFIVENAATYGIDTSWMFIGGKSAGSGVALNMIFADQDDWNGLIPDIADNWGDLNTSGNTLTNDFSYKAVQNWCGGTVETAVQKDEMVPAIMFHGLLDNNTPIGSTPEGIGGSGAIHEILTDFGGCSVLYVDSVGGHCTEDRGKRVDATSCFFKRVMCNACTTNYLTELESPDCSDLSPVTSIDELTNHQSRIKVFPNPASGSFTITGVPMMQIEIWNIQGQLISTLHPNADRLKVDVSDYAPGLYAIKAKAHNNSAVEIHKLIIQ